MNEIIKFIKMIFTIFFTLALSIFSSFVNNTESKIDEYKYISSSKYINKIGPEILKCLREKDKSKLNNLFCDKVRNTEYLLKKINYIFEYIEKQGEIYVDESGEWIENGSHGSQHFSEITVSYSGYNYNKKIKISNIDYSLYIGFYLVNKKHKEYEGITQIILWNPKDNNKKIVVSSNSNNYNNDNNNNSKRVDYLGIDIMNYNYISLQNESVLPSDINEIDEYKISFEDLEKNARNW